MGGMELAWSTDKRDPHFATPMPRQSSAAGVEAHTDWKLQTG